MTSPEARILAPMRLSSLVTLAAAFAGAIGCGSNVATGSGGNGTGGESNAISPCPAAEPSAGNVPCGTEDFRCTYGDSVRPECRHDWICNAGKWTTTKNVCVEPPPNTCGTTPPTEGAICNGFEGSVCTFGSDICLCSACSGGPCMPNAKWSCAKPPAGCPATAPNDGSTCDQPGADCTYGFPCGSAGAHVKCTNGLWKWDTEIACPL